MILQDIINIIEAAAPLHAQELWDNSGLQLGERTANINAALLTVDVTESVVDEAIMKGCDLIVSHHPLFFLPIKQLVGETMQQRCALKAIRNNIAIYSAHTSLDNAPTGVSHHMAKVLGMVDCKVLVANPMDATLGSGVIGDLQEAMSPKQFVEYVAEVFACDKTPVR